MVTKSTGRRAFAVAGVAMALLTGCAVPAAQRPALAASSVPPEMATTPEVVTPEVLARHDYSLADTPNKRTALAYLYTAWNDRQLRHARLTYWTPGSWPALEAGGEVSGPPVSPDYTIHRVIEEGDQVVVLAYVRGFGLGEPFTTVFGTPGGPRIGDAVVEFFRFAPDGLIQAKWDIIEPLSTATYDFAE